MTGNGPAPRRPARGLYIAFPDAPLPQSLGGEAYADALLREASPRRAEGGPVAAWMAGGEPWRLTDRTLRALFTRLRSLFPFPAAERSIEWIAAEAAPERLSVLRRSGFDRICLTGPTGAPGYRPLRDPEETTRAIRAAREARFRVVAAEVDPFTGDEKILDAARAADHLSLTEDPAAGLSGEEWVRRYETARRVLEEGGRERYETVSFARRGARSVGLRLIAAGALWTGIGAGAVTTARDERRRNDPRPAGYTARVGRGEDSVVERVRRTGVDRFRERLLHGLRRPEGIHLGALAARHGAAPVRALEDRLPPFLRAGFLRRGGPRLVPTDRGLITAEGILTELLGERP